MDMDVVNLTINVEGEVTGPHLTLPIKRSSSLASIMHGSSEQFRRECLSRQTSSPTSLSQAQDWNVSIALESAGSILRDRSIIIKPKSSSGSLRQQPTWIQSRPTSEAQYRAIWDEVDNTSNPTQVPDVDKCGNNRMMMEAVSSLKMEWETIKMAPFILIVPLLLLVALVVAGAFGVEAASNSRIHLEQNAATAAALEAAYGLQVQLEEAMLEVTGLGSLVQQNPVWDAASTSFTNAAQNLVQQGLLPSLMLNLQLQPQAITAIVIPPNGGLKNIGHDVLSDAMLRADALHDISSGTTSINGPYQSHANKLEAYVRAPIFIGNISNGNELFGSPLGPATNCSVCYNASSQVIFWGFVTSQLNMEALRQGTFDKLKDLTDQGYLYALMKPILEGTMIISQTAQVPCEAFLITVPVNFCKTATWQLQVGPSSSWEPVWRIPLLVCVVVIPLLLCILLYVVLASKQRYSWLLTSMLPDKVVYQLLRGQHFVERHECVTILFSDIVSYTNLAAGLAPIELAALLNEVYSLFDDLIAKHGIYKVETIGDGFMAVGGAPEPEEGEAAAVRVANMALDMLRCTRDFVSKNGHAVRIRLGIHSGPVVAAVIGRRMPRYCLFGDCVNTASRMESSSKPNCIQISSNTAALLKRATMDGQFRLQDRGGIEVKGKGRMYTYWLEAMDSEAPPPDEPGSDPYLSKSAEVSLADMRHRPSADFNLSGLRPLSIGAPMHSPFQRGHYQNQYYHPDRPSTSSRDTRSSGYTDHTAMMANTPMYYEKSPSGHMWDRMNSSSTMDRVTASSSGFSPCGTNSLSERPTGTYLMHTSSGAFLKHGSMHSVPYRSTTHERRFSSINILQAVGEAVVTEASESPTASEEPRLT